MVITIWIVTPTNYQHSRAFDEVAIALCAAFRALGEEAFVVRDPVQLGDLTIVLGANLLHLVPMPQTRLVLFNLEQVTPPDSTSKWMKPEYLALLRRFPIWDYSHVNIGELRKLGIDAIHCGIGYVPELSAIAPARQQDIGVLFFGSFNEHRNTVLNRISELGIAVTRKFGVYGAERDALIARSKIVLNLHLYTPRLFEIVRVSYLLANRKCVVSESSADPLAEAAVEGGVAFAEAADLPDLCARLLADDARRTALATAGFNVIRRLSQVQFVHDAMRETRERGW